MTARRALVLVNGTVQELPSGDTLVGAGGGSASYTEVELDFGSTPVKFKTFTVTDAGVSSTSKIMIAQSGAAPTGRSADENELDIIHCRAVPGSGQFTVYATCLTGTVLGKYKFNYSVGA